MSYTHSRGQLKAQAGRPKRRERKEKREDKGRQRGERVINMNRREEGAIWILVNEGGGNHELNVYILSVRRRTDTRGPSKYCTVI